jgi:anti-anti-sigma factor
LTELGEVSIAQEGGATIATLRGEVDLSNARAIGKRIVHAIPNHASGLVVDLSELRYLDSAGIRLLFDLARRLERRQLGLASVVPRGSLVREILEIAGGAERLRFVEERAEGLRRVAASEGPSG